MEKGYMSSVGHTFRCSCWRTDRCIIDYIYILSFFRHRTNSYATRTTLLLQSRIHLTGGLTVTLIDHVVRLTGYEPRLAQ